MIQALTDRQLTTWGVLVQNSNMSAAHLANGLVQIMRLYPSFEVAPLNASQSGYAAAYLQEIERHLSERSTHQSWKLPPAVHALCVTKTKQGPIDLQEPPKELSGAVAQLRALLHGELPSSEAHQAISSALNADGRVYIKGGADPTTPGILLAGYTSTHTISSMCAVTLVSALTATPKGQAALKALYALLSDDLLPQVALIKQLGLTSWSTSSTSPHERLLLPLPATELWIEEASRLATLYENLLSWRGHTLPEAEALMAVIDLMGLTISSRLFRWAKTPSLPLICPQGHAYTDRGAIAHAQRAFATALLQLREQSQEEKLSAEKTTPDKYVRNLLQTTGWLTPRKSQGGAKQALWPAARQLTTLTLSLLAHHEAEISWEELRARGQKLLHIDLGGEPLGAQLNAGPALRHTGSLNQEQLVALGLARRESDNVIRIDGGTR